MKKIGYQWGAAGHHHVSKESEANLLYRSRYLHMKVANRDENGLPINPEIFMDESFCVRLP